MDIRQPQIFLYNEENTYVIIDDHFIEGYMFFEEMQSGGAAVVTYSNTVEYFATTSYSITCMTFIKLYEDMFYSPYKIYAENFNLSNSVDFQSKNLKEFIVTDYQLEQNYPNPFNCETVIHYCLTVPSYIHLIVYNLQGQEICKLFEGYHESGRYQYKWDGKDVGGNFVSAGVYICKLNAGDCQKSIRMILMK